MNLTAILFVLTVSIGILFFIIQKISYTSLNFFKDIYEEKLIKHKENLLRKIDECFDNEKTQSIFPILNNAFYLNKINNVPKFIKRIHYQNISLLARMIALSDNYSLYIKNLKKMEELIDNHQSMLEKRYKKSQFILSLKNDEKHKKNSSSNWATKTIKEEIKILDTQIKENKINFLKELNLHITELKKFKDNDIYQ